MTRLTVLLSVLVALGTAGCDEVADVIDPRSDTERLVQDSPWTAYEAQVIVDGAQFGVPGPFGIPVADLAAEGDVQTFTFRSDGTFAFHFDPADGRTVTISYRGTTYASFPLNQTVDLSGTYTVDERADEITFSTVPGQAVDDFMLGYDFGPGQSDSVELIAEDPATLSLLFGLADPDAAQLARFVTGGSISYSRDN